VNTIMKHGNPELLVNMTNDAWFGDTSEPWEHMALSKMRAIEQRRFFVRSTNSGVSGFVDPAGRLIAHTGTFEQASLAAELAWLDGSTPYRLWGESPWWLASLAAVVLSFVRRRRAAASLGPPAPADEPSQL
jgi:apolipoprotein N-acyltransferase